VTGEQLYGKPDMVFPRKRIVIFVDGCFWHGCPECDKSPEQSGEFWVKKIETNKKRDQRVTSELKSQGWTVLRVPEHDVRTKVAVTQTVNWLLPLIRSGPSMGGNFANGDEGV
jgi:DNA mismatch endonuclease (patch repair protein)